LHGLYRNAFNDIRYILECIVQALYVDDRHPDAELVTKIEILKEVEDRREYHAVRLIDELNIDHKEKLRIQYRKLSGRIHPSHKQIVSTLIDVTDHSRALAAIDCEKVLEIYNAMRAMYDIFLYLLFVHFEEIRDSMRVNAKFLEGFKAHRQPLLSRIFKSG
jgi:hypothetical protein